MTRGTRTSTPTPNEETKIQNLTGSDFFCHAVEDLIEASLDEDGKPALRSGLTTDKRDSAFVHTQEDFSSWFRDTEYSKTFSDFITLDEATGKFTFESQAFFPVDGLGWAARPQQEQHYFAYKPPPTGGACATAWCYVDGNQTNEDGCSNACKPPVTK